MLVQIRDVLDLFWDTTTGIANEAADKYANDTEGIPEVCQLAAVALTEQRFIHEHSRLELWPESRCCKHQQASASWQNPADAQLCSSAGRDQFMEL